MAASSAIAYASPLCLLLEQNTQLRKDLQAAQQELRKIRIDQLAAQCRDGGLVHTPRDAELAQLRQELDAAVAAERPGSAPSPASSRAGY